MPLYKRCSRCGKRLQMGKKCECMKERHREYDRYTRDEELKRFYNSSQWERARNEALLLDDGIDIYVYLTTGEILVADTVHHIEPVKENWEKRLDINNLISLNHSTHSLIEQKYKREKKKMQEELKAIVIQYRENIPSGG